MQTGGFSDSRRKKMNNLKNKIITAVTIVCASCCAVASSPKVNNLLKLAEKIGMSEDQMYEFRSACDDYDRAEYKLKELSNLHGLTKVKPKRKTVISADVRDPAIRQIAEEAKKYKARYQVLKKTINKFGPHTNLTARIARQSIQARLDETRAERDAAKAYEKQIKELQKSAKKDGKNLAKLRKDLEKYRDKAETDAFRETCQRLLEVLPTPNE